MAKKSKNKTQNLGRGEQFQKTMQQTMSKQNQVLIGQEVSKQLQQMLPYIQRVALEGHKNLLVRTAVLEDLLLETIPTLDRNQLQAKVTDKQDELMGYTVSEKPAEVGDTIRMKIAHRKDGEKEFSGLQDGMIQRLTRIHNQQTQSTQIFPEVEEALVGLSVGEEAIVAVDVDEPEFDEKGQKVADAKVKYDIKVSIEKIMVSSEEAVTRQVEAAKAEEAAKANAEAQAEAETVSEEAPSEG